jgi:hypothetical protein
MSRLLPTDKGMDWYFSEMEEHVREIRDLYRACNMSYKGKETCQEHSRVEAYDLIVLTAEAFKMPEVLDAVPDDIIERFNKKRTKKR